MPACGGCGAELKPLFTGWFCPKDCDREPPKPVRKPVATVTHRGKLWDVYVEKITDAGRGWHTYAGHRSTQDERFDEFITNPQAFSDLHWGPKEKPGWEKKRHRLGSPTDPNYRPLHIVPRE